MTLKGFRYKVIVVIRQNKLPKLSKVWISCRSSWDKVRTRFCTQFGTLFGVAHANLGLNKTKTTKTASKIKAKTRPSMEVRYWTSNKELRAWMKTSKNVPMTRSNWLKRPRSQSREDQDTTRLANQL